MSSWTFTPSDLEVERRAFRASQARRSTIVALVSTLAFGAVVYLTVTNAPGWERTRATFFDVSSGWEVLPEIARGLWLNLRVLAVAAVLVVVVGLVLARTLRVPSSCPFASSPRPTRTSSAAFLC